MSVFVTLGPMTNHEFAARRYLEFHDAQACTLDFVAAPGDGFRGLLAGQAEFFILCSVHPQTPRLLCEFAGRVFIVDSFVSPSKPLAILSRADIAHPRKIGLFAPTVGLAATDRWPQVIVETEGTLATLGAKLRAGDYDSALTYREFADEAAGEFRVECEIDSPDDAWIVLATRRATQNGILASRDTLVGRALTMDRDGI